MYPKHYYYVAGAHKNHRSRNTALSTPPPPGYTTSTYILPHTPHWNLGHVVLDSLVCCIYQPCAKAQRGDSSIMLSVFRKLSIWTELSEGYGEQCRTDDPLMDRANNAARAPQGRLVVLCDKRGSVIFLKKTRKHYIECCSQHKGLTSTHGEAKHAILMDRGCAQLQRNLFFRVTIVEIVRTKRRGLHTCSMVCVTCSHLTSLTAPNLHTLPAHFAVDLHLCGGRQIWRLLSLQFSSMDLGFKLVSSKPAVL